MTRIASCFIQAAHGWRTPTRSIRAVPVRVRVGLILALAVQIAWHAFEPAAGARREALPPAPPPAALRLTALGEPTTLAASALLWLQFFDEQPGIQVSWRDLDYEVLRGWLERLLTLQPRSDYPLLLAVRIYGQVADERRQRIMFDFVRHAFVERPAERWRWLAEAALVAKHRLGDLDLALEYTRELNEQTRVGEIPAWARDLQILILEDMGELEAARILIGGMLDSGAIEDPNEIRFLERKLEALERRQQERRHQ